MRKIINGFRYDTSKARQIGKAEAPEYCTDFRWWKEALYVTPTAKRHFLAGEGNAMSRWGQWTSSGSGREGHAGSGIRPLSREEALEWAERYLDPEEVEAAFADMIEDA